MSIPYTQFQDYLYQAITLLEEHPNAGHLAAAVAEATRVVEAQHDFGDYPDGVTGKVHLDPEDAIAAEEAVHSAWVARPPSAADRHERSWEF